MTYFHEGAYRRNLPIYERLPDNVIVEREPWNIKFITDISSAAPLLLQQAATDPELLLNTGSRFGQVFSSLEDAYKFLEHMRLKKTNPGLMTGFFGCIGKKVNNVNSYYNSGEIRLTQVRILIRRLNLACQNLDFSNFHIDIGGKKPLRLRASFMDGKLSFRKADI